MGNSTAAAVCHRGVILNGGVAGVRDLTFGVWLWWRGQECLLRMQCCDLFDYLTGTGLSSGLS